jgi:hypothetical protein
VAKKGGVNSRLEPVQMLSAPPRIPPSAAPSPIVKATMNKRKWQRRTRLFESRMLGLRIPTQRKNRKKMKTRRTKKSREEDGEVERPLVRPSSLRMFLHLNPVTTQPIPTMAASSSPTSYGSTSAGLPSQLHITTRADQLLIVSAQLGVEAGIRDDALA